MKSSAWLITTFHWFPLPWCDFPTHYCSVVKCSSSGSTRSTRGCNAVGDAVAVVARTRPRAICLVKCMMTFYTQKREVIAVDDVFGGG